MKLKFDSIGWGFTAQSPIQESQQQTDIVVKSIRLIETNSCNNRIDLVWFLLINDASNEGRGQTAYQPRTKTGRIDLKKFWAMFNYLFWSCIQQVSKEYSF